MSDATATAALPQTQTTASQPTTTTDNRKRATVADLQPGTTVNELFVLSDLQVRQGGKTGRYVTFRAADATGSIKGVFWPAEAGEAEGLLEEVEEGAVARIKGDIVSYRNQTEIRVSAPAGGISAFAGPQLDASAFVATSPMSERELRDAVEVRIGLVADKSMRRILRAFFADKERAEAYFQLPARLSGAHAHLRGLAEEAVEVARIAGAAAASIPGVNRDIVSTAALLAPAGAILAFQELGLAHEETKDGVLLPRHVLAADITARAAKEAGSVPIEIVQKLRHVLLREPEVPRWGWSSGPDTLMPETVILHHALKMSQLVPEVTEALKRREPDLAVE